LVLVALGHSSVIQPRKCATPVPLRPAQSGAALPIARELISRKLAGQEQVARDKLLDSTTADIISRYREALLGADMLETIRLIESQAAAVYWAAWRNLPIMFPKSDLPRVPEHWRKFGTRKSLLTGSPRLAVDPPNAILNYLYAVLESEARLASAALGLDPGLGLLHLDTPNRDSLTCDLMEAVRPQVDGYLLDWITRQPLRREWFFEQRDGNCRLMGSFAVRLSETAPTWARAIAPVAESVARALWQTTTKPARQLAPATRLTQSRRREAKGSSSMPPPERAPRLQTLCRGCGKIITPGRSHCAECAVESATERLVEVARLGRQVAHTPKARAKQGSTQRQHRKAQLSWSASSQPEWLTEEVYSQKIQPLLARMSNSAIASLIGVSGGYAGRIRQGYRPHPRHWQKLAESVEMSCSSSHKTASYG